MILALDYQHREQELTHVLIPRTHHGTQHVRVRRVFYPRSELVSKDGHIFPHVLLTTQCQRSSLKRWGLCSLLWSLGRTL